MFKDCLRDVIDVIVTLNLAPATGDVYILFGVLHQWRAPMSDPARAFNWSAMAGQFDFQIVVEDRKLMSRLSRFSTLLLFGLGELSFAPANAAALQVSPVTLDLTIPTRTASIDLRNTSEDPANVQVRIYKWSQIDGQDLLALATNVVASPPATTVLPGNTYTIRLAHMNLGSVKGEEGYRLVIDELPNINVRRRSTSVQFVTRYSIPVFFSDRLATANLRWSVRRRGKNIDVAATNIGTRHAKIAGLKMTTGRNTVHFGDGLNGYVLPGSTMHWSTGASSINAGSHVRITAKGDDYAVNETAVVSGQ